jgi:hypothetical protein
MKMRKGCFNLMTDIFIEKKKYEAQQKELAKEASARPIVCGVMNCRWHDGISRCKAPSIHVGPGYASSSVDTVCATFEPKVIM